MVNYVFDTHGAYSSQMNILFKRFNIDEFHKTRLGKINFRNQ